ncbi:MAG: hypothetical protein SGPRY_013157 [Prymnesium sp.]
MIMALVVREDAVVARERAAGERHAEATQLARRVKEHSVELARIAARVAHKEAALGASSAREVRPGR